MAGYRKASSKTRWVLLGTHDIRIHRVFCVVESNVPIELNSNYLAKGEKTALVIDTCHSYAEKYFICLVYEEFQVFKF